MFHLRIFLRIIPLLTAALGLVLGSSNVILFAMFVCLWGYWVDGTELQDV